MANIGTVRANIVVVKMNIEVEVQGLSIVELQSSIVGLLQNTVILHSDIVTLGFGTAVQDFGIVRDSNIEVHLLNIEGAKELNTEVMLMMQKMRCYKLGTLVSVEKKKNRISRLQTVHNFDIITFLSSMFNSLLNY